MMHELDPSVDAELIRLVLKTSTTNRPVPGLGFVTSFMTHKTGDGNIIVKVWTL